MNNNKQYIGIVLIMLILLGYQWLFPPIPTPKNQDNTRALNSELGSENVIINQDLNIVKQENTENVLISEKKILANDFLEVVLDTKGAQIEKITLKKEKKYIHGSEKEQFPNLVFLDEKSKIDLEFLNLNQQIKNSKDFIFTVIDEKKSSIEFLWEDEFGGKLIFTYQLNEEDLLFSLKTQGLQQTFAPGVWYWNFHLQPEAKEKNNEMDRNASSIFYQILGQKRDFLSETSNDQKKIEGALNWLAFKTLYYSLILLPEKNLNFKADLHVKNPENKDLVKDYQAKFTFNDFNPYQYEANFTVYCGPNQFQTLQKWDRGVEELVNFGWGIVRYINEYFMVYVFSFFLNHNVSVPLALLLLTLLMKLILFPLYQKSYISSAKMRLLRPDMEEINKKFSKKEDALKKQQAQLALYRQSGVNPMAGCIPLLIQMPILFALFRFFPNLYELRLESFLWADDLSAYDSIYTFENAIPIYGDHVSLITILFAISMIFYSKLNATNMAPQQEGMPDMRMMLYILPLFSIVFFNNYASGLSLYYLIANVISILQTFLFRYWVDEQKLFAKIETNKKKVLKPSKFQKKLEELSQQTKMKNR